MKIIIVHNSYQQPGGEDFVFQQEHRLLEERGHEVVTYERSNWDADAYKGIKRISLAKRTIWASDTRREFAALLKREKPDLVHVHNTFIMISPSIYAACREADVPVVQTLHNYRLFCPVATFFRDGRVCEDCVDRGLMQSIRHSCYRDSAATTAVTALMLTVHRHAGTWAEGIDSYISLTEFSRSRCLRAGLPADKVFVKPNFVHPDPGIGPGNGDYAVFVGRLSPEKRVSTMLNAWRRLAEKGVSIPLWVVGGGPERVELEAEAREQKLDNVIFKGLMPRPETIKAIGAARFLVFSSEWYENFPLTIAESFARGVPVISSRLGAMEEIVDNGRTGIHFTPGDPDDLAAKVAWAWKHPHLMQAMGKEARSEFEAKYVADENYRQLMHIYTQTLLRRGKNVPADGGGKQELAEVSEERSQ